jgi:phosphatidylserine decarboxylase
VRLKDERKVLIRQIAGFVARRIVNYVKPGTAMEQNSTLGFIKFGSRVDIFIPKDSELYVEIGDPVIGSQTPIARISK